jgi:hypothetical protein
MLKFDPDDPDDDEPNGAPPKVTIKLGGDDVRPSEQSDGAGDRSVPEKSRQNTQHEQQKVKMGIFVFSYDSCDSELSFWGCLCRHMIFCAHSQNCEKWVLALSRLSVHLHGTAWFPLDRFM